MFVECSQGRVRGQKTMHSRGEIRLNVVFCLL